MGSLPYSDNPAVMESANCIEKCNSNRCVTCLNRLCLDSFVENHITGERFDILLNGSCNTKNCIYVIKCSHPCCQYQYVGHTINTVSKRMSSHRSSIAKGAGCKVLKDHFTNVHCIVDMKIMPIAPLPVNIKLKQREELEDSWMLKLNTVFPYGLNVRVKKAGILDATMDVLRSKYTVYSKFDVLKINRHYRGTGKHDAEKMEDCTFSVDTFYSLLFNSRIVNFRDVRTSLCKLKKKQLKKIYIKSIAQK